jgi:hypothetical protein
LCNSAAGRRDRGDYRNTSENANQCNRRLVFEKHGLGVWWLGGPKTDSS